MPCPKRKLGTFGLNMIELIPFLAFYAQIVIGLVFFTK